MHAVFVRVVIGFLIVGVVWISPPARALTDAEVDRKIAGLKQLIYSQQDPRIGGWFGAYHGHPSQDAASQDPLRNKNLGGPTAIACLALLVSGESSQDPRLDRGIDYLRTLDMYGTYALSLKVHVWSYLPQRYRDFLDRDARRLLHGADPLHATWHYVCYPQRDDGWDNSTNQYGILGVWQYTQRGGHVPPLFWKKVAEHFFQTQRPDGGWAYQPDKQTTVSMTCAGLTCLYVVQQALFRDHNQPPAEWVRSIHAGLAYLDRHFDPAISDGHGGGGYPRYGYERVALASGLKYLGGRDWFEAIGSHIVHEVPHTAGRSVVTPAFDLMFLARGRIPVWISKIQLSQGDWNHRPSDLYFLSRDLSKMGEKEVNWQVVGLDRPAAEWLNAPVAWLSTDKAIVLTGEEKAHLKRYLDLGGTLVVNNESSNRLDASVTRLGGELYPDLRWRDLDASHPIANLWVKVASPAKLPVRALGNGARELIYVTRRDWGLTLQKQRDLSQTAAAGYMTNLYALVSDRGNLPNRLERPFPPRTEAGGTPLWVCQATLGPGGGQANPEPEAWTPLASTLANDAGVDLRWIAGPLDRIGGGKIQGNPITLVHLAGVDPVELSADQKGAIQRFVEGGGVILVETVGGRGEFAVHLERQLCEVFGVPSSRIARTEPVICGQGLPGGGSVARAVYRKFSVINMGVGLRHRLRAIRVNDRPAVIFSSEDLSLGVLGVRHWGINGYAPDTARQIVTNILMAASEGV